MFSESFSKCSVAKALSCRTFWSRFLISSLLSWWASSLSLMSFASGSGSEATNSMSFADSLGQRNFVFQKTVFKLT